MLRKLAPFLLLALAALASAQQATLDRYALIEKTAEPFKRQAAKALEEKQYQASLILLQKAEAAWKSGGFAQRFPVETAECYLGLGQYQKVIDTVRAAKGTSGTLPVCAECIALVKLGKATEAHGLYQDQFIAKYLPPMAAYHLLPPKKTTTQFYATLHLARGVELCASGDAVRSEDELRQANKLTPSQPLICYFLGRLLKSEGREVDAAPYLKKSASLKLPG